MSPKGVCLEMRRHRKLSYANVVATLALFLALGGISYAAFKLPKNSVGSKQLKKNAVTAKKIKKNAVTTAKIRKQAVTAAKVKKGTLTGAQINLSTLGTVPSAQLANTLAPAENWQGVSFENGWKDGAGGGFQSVGFYKDQTGVVHLRGVAIEGTGGKSVFRLPPGYRPAGGTLAALPVVCGGCTGAVGIVLVVGSGVPGIEGTVVPISGGTSVGFDGVSFRAES